MRKLAVLEKSLVRILKYGGRFIYEETAYWGINVKNSAMAAVQYCSRCLNFINGLF